MTPEQERTERLARIRARCKSMRDAGTLSALVLDCEWLLRQLDAAQPRGDVLPVAADLGALTDKPISIGRPSEGGRPSEDWRTVSLADVEARGRALRQHHPIDLDAMAEVARDKPGIVQGPAMESIRTDDVPTLRLVHNDGSGTETTTDLPASVGWLASRDSFGMQPYTLEDLRAAQMSGLTGNVGRAVDALTTEPAHRPTGWNHDPIGEPTPRSTCPCYVCIRLRNAMRVALQHPVSWPAIVRRHAEQRPEQRPACLCDVCSADRKARIP